MRFCAEIPSFKQIIMGERYVKCRPCRIPSKNLKAPETMCWIMRNSIWRTEDTQLYPSISIVFPTSSYVLWEEFTSYIRKWICAVLNCVEIPLYIIKNDIYVPVPGVKTALGTEYGLVWSLCKAPFKICISWTCGAECDIWILKS